MSKVAKGERIMKTKKIFSRKLAIYLREYGCKIISTEVNRHKPNLDVYIFEDTPELRILMDNYKT